MILLGLLALANFVAVFLVLGSLVGGGSQMTGLQLLATAAVVLLVNVITFALVFWEVDCGGPVARAMADRRVTPDFQFPQDENPELAHEGLGAGAPGLSLHRGHELDRVQPDRRDAADPPREAVHGDRVVRRGGDVADRRRQGSEHPPGLTLSRDSHASPTRATGSSQTAALGWVSPRTLPKGVQKMRLTKTRMLLATVTALALMVGVGTAFAASGNGPTLKQQAAEITSRTTFDAAVASNLGTTTAKLNAAIKAAATARINAALAAGDITAAEATTLKDALADGDDPGGPAGHGGHGGEGARHDRGEAERRLRERPEGAGHRPRRRRAQGRPDHRGLRDRR